MAGFSNGVNNFMNTVMIDVEKVSRHFGRIVALDEVSFKVQKGEIVGFLGPNGAGKTTMMRILACFLPPTNCMTSTPLPPY